MLRSAAVCLSLAAPVSAQQFATEVVPLPGSGGWHVAIADVDHDGLPDPVLTAWSQLTVLRNAGTDGFQSTVLSLLNLMNEPRLLDLDGDGHVDLCAGAVFGPVAYRGHGDGSWTAMPGLPGFNGQVVFADVDADGDPDLIGSHESTQILVSRNDGAGGFGPATVVATSPSMFSFGRLALGDLNGDGHVDVVSLSYTWVRILFGDGAGGFVEQPLWTLAQSQYCLAVADLDGDGDRDLVLGNSVWLNGGTGSFTLAATLPFVSPFSAVAADLDGDGVADLVLGNEASVAIFRGLGNGTFVATSIVPTGPTRSLAASDMDADGDIDITAVSYDGLQMRLLRNTSLAPGSTGTLGTGTPACGGHIGIRASHDPVPGHSAFRIVSTNTPPNATGLLLVGPCMLASDPFGLGLMLHVDSAMSLGVMASDPVGAASIAVPLPPDQGLIGLVACVQSIWVGDPGLGNTCSTAQFELASSAGLVLLF